MTAGTQPFQKLKPCVGANGHKFIVSRPPEGHCGYALVVCERCGMTKEEARR